MKPYLAIKFSLGTILVVAIMMRIGFLETAAMLFIADLIYEVREYIKTKKRR